jgi:hypothetical protein
VLAVLLAGTVLAQVADTTAVDRKRQLLILEALRKTKERWVETSEDFISVDPLFKGVAEVRVQWGLARDPMPDPFVYYATPENRIVHSFAEALNLMRYVPADLSDALRVALLIVKGEDRHATVIASENDLEAVPKQMRRKHKVKPASVKTLKNDGYRAVVFAYQPHHEGGFTSLHRVEALNRYTVTIEQNRYDCQVEQLASGLLRPE